MYLERYSGHCIDHFSCHRGQPRRKTIDGESYFYTGRLKEKFDLFIQNDLYLFYVKKYYISLIDCNFPLRIYVI